MADFGQKAGKVDVGAHSTGRLPMKRLMIFAFATVALLAATTATLRAPSTKLSAGTATMPSLRELHTAAGVNKLPIEDFEDMSLVYSTVTMRAK
jgi:hypothetical protein